MTMTKVSRGAATKTNVLKELFGSGRFSKPTKQLLEQSRKNESKFF